MEVQTAKVMSVPWGFEGSFEAGQAGSGMRYKAKRDDLERIGLIRMTRKKADSVPINMAVQGHI